MSVTLPENVEKAISAQGTRGDARLQLTNMGLDNAHMVLLAEEIKAHSFSFIDLGYNNFDERGALILKRVLEGTFSELNFNNCNIGDEFDVELVRSKTITHMDLGGNTSLTDASAAKLKQSNIENLSLADTRIDPAVLNEIYDQIDENCDIVSDDQEIPAVQVPVAGNSAAWWEPVEKREVPLGLQDVPWLKEVPCS